VKIQTQWVVTPGKQTNITCHHSRSLPQVDENGLEMASNVQRALYVFQLGQMIQKVEMNGHVTQTAQANWFRS
jgi:hypothetical protein